MQRNVLEYLEATAPRLPDKVAFTNGAYSLTFGDLSRAARGIGTFLGQKGLHGEPVVVFMEKHPCSVAAFFGVVYAGCYYVPIDEEMPKHRVSLIFQNLKPRAVICDEKTKAMLGEFDYQGDAFLYEEMAGTPVEEERLLDIRRKALDVDPLYIVFTSGSTGEPKGVAITHRNVLAYSEWVVNTFAFGPGTVLGNQTPLYFSMSVTDLYGAMRGGACVQILPKRLFSFPVQLLDYLTARGVNAIYWVPSALGIVANWKALDYTALPPLRTVLFAGEVMPTAKLNYWRAHYPEALFANLYGPTETTDICAYYIVDRAFADDEPLPIGRPCENCGVLLLKPDGSCAAPGEEGELCVRGSFVAAGYYNQPDKTAERFTLNPAQPHYPERIYRTGDLARWNAHGELMYGGRLDNQIKHRGYRIELGEIETAAAGQDRLDECACLYDAARDCLVLFYQGRRDLAQALRTRLAGRLPAYMQPAEYRRLNPMPHNPNGKIDRPALQALLSQTH